MLTQTQKNILMILSAIVGGILVGLLFIILIKRLRSNSEQEPTPTGCVKTCEDKTCGPSNCEGDPCGQPCSKNECQTCEEKGYQCGNFKCQDDEITCPNCEDGKTCNNYQCVDNIPEPSPKPSVVGKCPDKDTLCKGLCKGKRPCPQGDGTVYYMDSKTKGCHKSPPKTEYCYWNAS